jgi:hypothetical protein
MNHLKEVPNDVSMSSTVRVQRLPLAVFVSSDVNIDCELQEVLDMITKK